MGGVDPGFTYEGCVAQGFPAPAKPRHSVCVSSFILPGPSSPSSWCGRRGLPCSAPFAAPVDEPSPARGLRAPARGREGRTRVDKRSSSPKPSVASPGRSTTATTVVQHCIHVACGVLELAVPPHIHPRSPVPWTTRLGKVREAPAAPFLTNGHQTWHRIDWRANCGRRGARRGDTHSGVKRGPRRISRPRSLQARPEQA